VCACVCVCVCVLKKRERDTDEFFHKMKKTTIRKKKEKNTRGGRLKRKRDNTRAKDSCCVFVLGLCFYSSHAIHPCSLPQPLELPKFSGLLASSIPSASGDRSGCWSAAAR